jgi:hypothetical protein
MADRHTPSKGPVDPAHLKICTNGQYNFSPACAMLSLETYRMMSAATPVGAPLPSPEAWWDREPPRRTAQGGGGTNHCISNRNKVRIEIRVSHSKQTIGTNSNRNSFRGSAKRREENSWRGGGSAKAKRDPSTTTRARRNQAGKSKTREASRGMTTKGKGAGLTLRLHSGPEAAATKPKSARLKAAATWAKRKTSAMIQIPRSIFRISRASPGGAWSHDSGPSETPGAHLRSSDTPRLRRV